MGPFGWMHQAVDGLRELPGVRQARRIAFDREFEKPGAWHLFRGVFDSFDAALASAPSARAIGFDNRASAKMYIERLHIDDYDHPAMFWVAQSLVQGMRTIADIGGSVGIKYFAFGRFVDFPPDMVWQVIEVPAAVREGRQFAAEHGVSDRLQFSTDTADVDGKDLLLAFGSLQFTPQSLPEILGRAARKPARIVVNTTPIHATRSFFTLHNSGHGFCPYRVQARDAFVRDVESQGYILRDEWKNIGKKMELTQERGYSLDHYAGFCFDAVR